MQEPNNDNHIDNDIVQTVESYYTDHCSDNKPDIINPDKVSRLIDTLRHSASPGIDGITAEHLQYGKSDILCSIIASSYSVILTYSYVPSTFTCGVIVSVIKKVNT